MEWRIKLTEDQYRLVTHLIANNMNWLEASRRNASKSAEMAGIRASDAPVVKELGAEIDALGVLMGAFETGEKRNA